MLWGCFVVYSVCEGGDWTTRWRKRRKIQNIFHQTDKFRFGAFQNFLRSLVLFVVDIFLSALMCLPEEWQGIAAALGGMAVTLAYYAAPIFQDKIVQDER